MNAVLTPVQTRSVAVGPRQIHLNEFGSGPAVLMLHGGGPGASGLSNYSRNIQALAQRFRVLVPDMPGYGQSSKGVADDPFGDIAGAMLGLLDALDIARAHVVGNSLGGAVRAAHGAGAPQRVGRLVLMGPGGIGISQNATDRRAEAAARLLRGRGPDAGQAAQLHLRRPGVRRQPHRRRRCCSERFDASIDARRAGQPAAARAEATWRPSSAWTSCSHPRLPMRWPTATLVLWGTEDRVNPPSGALALQARLPACDVYLFSRTGHWVQWERADEFNAVVAAFLAADA